MTLLACQVFLARSVYDRLLPMNSALRTAYDAAKRRWTVAGVVLTFRTADEAAAFRAEALS